MSKPLKSFFEATEYLGSFMPDIVPFLGLTACMSEDRRKQVALLEWLKEIMPKLKDIETMEPEQILKEFIQPLIEKLGYAEWVRDTVTDMAIKRGRKEAEDIWPKEGEEEKKEGKRRKKKKE